MCGCKTGGLGKSIECPNCGKKFRSIGGVKQKACPFCKAPMTYQDNVITSEDCKP